jgi:Ca2+-transporting ATPase
LWINLVASGLQDIALAFEPGDGESLNRKPLSQKEGIMSVMMMRRTFLVGGVISLGVIGLYSQALRTGLSLEEARSLAMTVTVLFQFFQVWNSRSETKSIFNMNLFSNPFLFVSMVLALAMQLAVLYIPSLQGIFETFALNVSEWIMLLLVASSVVLMVEIDKAVVRSNTNQ